MDLALSNRIVECAAEHAHELERASRKVRAVMTTAMWRSGIAGAFYAWQFSGVAVKMSDTVVWLRGARAMSLENTAVSDPDGDIDAGLRTLSKVARRLHGQVVEVLPLLETANIGGTRRSLQRALRDVAKQSNEIHKSAETFVSELAAHDADVIAHEPGWRASSAEQVREMLSRI